MSTAPVQGIVELASRLVMTPSCGGIGPPQPVLGVVRAWREEHGPWAAPVEGRCRPEHRRAGRFGNMHAADEWAGVGSFEPVVYAMSCEAMRQFLSRP